MTRLFSVWFCNDDGSSVYQRIEDFSLRNVMSNKPFQTNNKIVRKVNGEEESLSYDDDQ